MSSTKPQKTDYPANSNDLAGKRNNILIVAAGLLAVFAAFIPQSDLEAPPVLDVKIEDASFPELLSLRGIGEKKATEIREERIEKTVGGLTHKESSK